MLLQAFLVDFLDILMITHNLHGHKKFFRSLQKFIRQFLKENRRFYQKTK
jgi:hypothetical protein